MVHRRAPPLPLDHWWFTGARRHSVGTEADHSLDSTTASRPFEHRGHDGGGRDDGGDRHVPVEEPQLVRAAHQGVDRARDAHDGQPGHRGRVLDGGEAVAGGWTTHSAAPGWSPARDSTVTMESMPPPKGISGRPGAGLVGHGRSRRGIGTGHGDAAQVDAVAIGELAEPVHVVPGQEGALGLPWWGGRRGRSPGRPSSCSTTRPPGGTGCARRPRTAGSSQSPPGPNVKRSVKAWVAGRVACS